MTHDEAQRLLDAYLDGELDVASSLAVEAHAHTCEACTTWLAERRLLVAQLRSTPLRFPTPPGLSIRLAVEPEQRRSRLFFGSWPQSLAAGLLLATGGFFLGHKLPRAPDLSDQLVSAHVRSALSPATVDVLSSNHHTVKPWFAARLPFSPPVPELAGGGDTLLGGRLDYIEHTRVAAIVYRHGDHLVNVFIWPRTAFIPPAASATSIDGFHLATAQVGDFSAVLVSDMSIDELTAFRQRWSAAAGP